jgi:hypothetical protein
VTPARIPPIKPSELSEANGSPRVSAAIRMSHIAMTATPAATITRSTRNAICSANAAALHQIGGSMLANRRSSADLGSSSVSKPYTLYFTNNRY